jgi:transposase
MSQKIKAKKILELKTQGLAMQEIADTIHASKHSVCEVCRRADSHKITFDKIKDSSEDEVYVLLFPEKQASNNLFAPVDYDYVTKELRKTGVTMKLLHEEYKDKCSHDGLIPVGYTKFCTDYRAWRGTKDFSDRILHKPGVKVEVDWSGSTMEYTDRISSEKVPVYLFVGTLPYSQYAYVEACPNMNQESFLQCHVNMFEFFEGTPMRIVCDNLKTGVIQHPKEGDIVLNERYTNLAEHYGCAILPTGVKKPKHKASVEGNVGNIATAIIARLRNYKFYSFQEVKEAVYQKLLDFNSGEFDKREGSRYEVFQSEEKPLLRPLPEISYEPCTWLKDRTVQLNSHVAFEKNYYSCPHTYLHQHVDLKVTSSRVEIYHKGVRIQMHQRIPSKFKNRYSTVPSDMPEDKHFMEWNETRLLKWASEVGSKTEEVIRRIFDESTVREQGILPALSIMKLSKSFGSDRLEDACEFALTRVHSPRWKNLNSILNSNQDSIVRNERDKKASEVQGFLRSDDYYKKLEEAKKC